MNKLRYNVSFWLGALFLFVTGGCSDYFDVLPKSQARFIISLLILKEL